jgi:hypothetical protein
LEEFLRGPSSKAPPLSAGPKITATLIENGLMVTATEMAEIGVSKSRMSQLVDDGYAVLIDNEKGGIFYKFAKAPDKKAEIAAPAPAPAPEPEPAPEPVVEPAPEPEPVPEPAPTTKKRRAVDVSGLPGIEEEPEKRFAGKNMHAEARASRMNVVHFLLDLAGEPNPDLEITGEVLETLRRMENGRVFSPYKIGMTDVGVKVLLGLGAIKQYGPGNYTVGGLVSGVDPFDPNEKFPVVTAPVPSAIADGRHELAIQLNDLADVDEFKATKYAARVGGPIDNSPRSGAEDLASTATLRRVSNSRFVAIVPGASVTPVIKTGLSPKADPRITDGTLAQLAQRYLAGEIGNGAERPSHVFALDEKLANLNHEGASTFKGAKAKNGQVEFITDNNTKIYELFHRLGKEMVGPVAAANQLGSLVVARTGRQKKTHGTAFSGSTVTLRIESVNGEFVISDKDASQTLMDNEFYVSFPVIALDMDRIKGSDLGGERERLGLMDTALHEAWHNIFGGRLQYQTGIVRKQAEILKELRDAAPELYDALMSRLNPRLKGYDAGASREEERLVRIAAKISHAIMSDPAELELILKDIENLAKDKNALQAGYEWLVKNIVLMSRHIAKVVDGFLVKMDGSSAPERVTSPSEEATRMAVGEAIWKDKGEYPSSLPSNYSPSVVESARNLRRAASEITRIFSEALNPKYYAFLDAPIGEAMARIPKGKHDQVPALIRKANQVLRPYAMDHMSRLASDTFVLGPKGAPSFATIEVIHSDFSDELASNFDSSQIKYKTNQRSMLRKRMGGRSLTLTGISIVKEYAIAKSTVKNGVLAAIANGARRISESAWFASNYKSLKDASEKLSSISVDMDAVRSDPGYRSMKEAGRTMFDAAVQSATNLKADELDDAMSYDGKFSKDTEEEIASFVRKSGAKGNVASTLEFLVRLSYGKMVSKHMLDNRSSKGKDVGWAIPNITAISVSADGTLKIKTKTIPWGLDGDRISTKGLDKSALKSAKAREERRIASRINQSKTWIVNHVQDLVRRANEGDKIAQSVVREQAWYDTIFERLATAFGNQQMLFTELLAALSPQTPADANYAYAISAIESFVRGEYDDALKEYVDWVTDSNRIERVAELRSTIARRRASLKKAGVSTKTDPALKSLEQDLSDISVYRGKNIGRMVQVVQGQDFPVDPYEDSEGNVQIPKAKPFRNMDDLVKRYGPKKSDMGESEHYVAVEGFISSVIEENPDAFDDDGNLIEGATISVSPKFGTNSMGAMRVMAGIWAKNVKSPKVHTFFANLTGRSTNATIDLWAARAVRESLGLPRIPAYAEQGVKGSVVQGDIDNITGEYGFAQKVMDAAASEITARGIMPLSAKNLQALLWFSLKTNWRVNGWTTAQGAGGSFERSFDRDPLTLIGVEFDSTESTPDGAYIEQIAKKADEDKSVLSVRYEVNPRTDRRTANISMVVRYRDFDSNGFAASIGDMVRNSGSSMRVTVNQTVPYGAAKSPNARPGFIVRFPSNLTIEEATALSAQIEHANPEWDIEIENDGRIDVSGDGKTRQSFGMRVHYVAEADRAIRANVSRNEGESTDDTSVIKIRTKTLLRTLSDLEKAGIIAKTIPYAVESITFGAEGNFNDTSGVAAFTDYRGGRPVDARSVSGVVAEGTGYSGRFADPESADYFDANGPAGQDVRRIAEVVVPEEVSRAHETAVERTFPYDPYENEVASDDVKDELGVEDDGGRESVEFVEYRSNADVPLPEEIEAPSSRGGALNAVKRMFGTGEKIKIVGGKKEGDIGMFKRWFIPLLNSAWSSGNMTVRRVAEEMVATDLERVRITDGMSKKGNDLYSALPKQYRADNGRKFFILMDRYYDPNKDNSHPQWVDETGLRLEDDVINVLREFKKIGEQQRLGIIAEKRAAAKEVVSFMPASRLAKVARENGSNWKVEEVRYGPGKRDVVKMILDEDSGEYMYVDDARESLVLIMVPDDWGRQFSHIFHAFFGAYEGFWYDKSAYEAALAEGKSNEEALRIARRSISMDGGTATEATQAAMVRRLRLFKKNPPPGISKDNIMQMEIRIQTHVPPDVVRLSGKQYDMLRRQIEEAADVESDVVTAMLRGKIGRTEGKKRFYASILERKGKEGFDMDFMRAWEAQMSGYYKWLYFNRLRKNVTSSIEDLKRQGYIGWSSHLQDSLDYMTTFRQSQFEQMMDAAIASIPVIRTYVGPMPTRRWLQMVRTVNVMRQLWTIRQQFVNSLQPLQTVFPIIGTRNFLRYIARYNTREAKEVFAKYGYLKPNGEWYEGREFKLTSGTGWFSKIRDQVKSILSKSPISGPESRNQNFTFFAFYTWAREEIGMNEEEAARHALLRVAQTQFAFTKANNPVAFRGPARATLLQYKRFMFSSLGLAHNLFNSRDPRTGELMERSDMFAMKVRWIASFLLMGGLKGLPVFLLLDLLADKLTDDDNATGWDLYQSLREQLGENAANVMVFGLPAAAGVDISGSIVLLPKPYGRTTYDMIGGFLAGPTLSAIGDIYTSLTDKNAVYQSGFDEIWKGVYASSPFFQQIGTGIDLIAGDAEKYDKQGRLQFRRTTGDQIRGIMGLRTVRESLESLEYQKVVAMKEAIDAILDEISTLIASGDMYEARKKVMYWNQMFPEAPLPTNLRMLMKQPDISRRVSRKIDDRTLDTRQRRLKQVNDRLAKILVDREGFESEEVE